MRNRIFIGIDTSNYTTSVCAVLNDNNIISKRRLLPVKIGQRGLRQSDAVFEHIRALPVLYRELSDELNNLGFDIKNAEAIGVSTVPRNIENSYMPVFVAGKSFAEIISASLHIPLYTFSHQEGHIAAAVSENTEYLKKTFLSVHLSGGTCEILKTEYKDGHFLCDIVGKTNDISAGQFIDRVGVSMGFNFPAGQALEKTAFESKNPYKFPISVKGSEISFSGVETKAQQLIGNIDNSDIALGVFICIAKSIQKAIINISENISCDINNIMFVGGVSSNEIIKDNIRLPMKINFCKKEYATDNAVGIAYLTMLNQNLHERNYI